MLRFSGFLKQRIESNLKAAALLCVGQKNSMHTEADTTCKQSSPVETTEKEGIREIVMNEPKTRNSLSMEMMNALHLELKRNWNDETLRCIVLTANGNIWSAGHNLKELANMSMKEQEVVFAKLGDIILDIYKAPVPVLAKVNGLAAAAGCQLAASCDIVVCTEKSSFSTPGVNFGVFCSTPGIAVSRVMSRTKSSYMLFTGLPLSAEEAYVAGLVSRVVPENELDTEVKNIANAIKHKSRSVVAFGKKFFHEQLQMGVKDAYSAGANAMATNLQLPDGKEGLRSFLEKRKPAWSHKS